MQSDYRKELTQKATKEFGSYITELLRKPPEEILRSSHTTVAKPKGAAADFLRQRVLGIS